jgi:hypothetical protein
MKQIISISFGGLLLLGAGITPALAWATPNTCQAVVKDLNTKYNSTATSCPNGAPLYKCSGVFVHTFDVDAVTSQGKSQTTTCGTSDRGDPNAQWCPTAQGIKKGAVSFSYLRTGILSTQGEIIFPYMAKSATAGVGFIFNLASTPLQLYCSYPVDGQSDSRGNSGCGITQQNKQLTMNTDQSDYCKDVLAGGLTWANYEKYSGGNPPIDKKMCSISSANFPFFINVAKQVDYDAAAKIEFTDNEQVIQAWQGYQYNNIPIEAFFYATHDEKIGGKSDPSLARSQAAAFNKASGLNVPVVAINVSIMRNKQQSPFTCDAESK